MRTTVGSGLLDYLRVILEAGRNGNGPMRESVLISDCIERGKSMYEGGERYTFLQPIIIGFANAVDSLFAIRKLVYEQKKLSLAEFLDIVEKDYADA